MHAAPIDESRPLLSESRAAGGYSSLDGSDTQDNVGCELRYRQLAYTVPPSRSCFGGRRQLQVLRQVNGRLPPGMNAIMGPTGSGKTTLLDAVAGRKDPRLVSGQVLVDGRPQPPNFKCVSGYVPQDDVLMPTLTVRENLLFSAALRLPPGVDNDERRRRVDELLLRLGLSLVADTRIGGPRMRGVSGGERKRTSIGMEVIFQPPVLFLDEPTTGLDASTAYSVMELLHSLSRTGKTIVFSIHQPRYSIFRTFDSLTILSKGETVFQGRADGALAHFEKLGFRCEQFNNPLDLFLDIVNGDTRRPDGGQLTKDDVHAELVSAFKASDAGRQETTTTTTTTWPPASPTYASSAPRQLAYVAGRAFRNVVRNPQASLMQVATNLIFALLVGIIYLQLPADLVSGVQNRVGVFFFVTMTMMFGSMGAVELFLLERPLFVHENTSGYYRVSVYFLAKVFCDLVPMRTLPLLLFAPVSYFVVGLEPSVEKFLIYTLNLQLLAMANTGLAFFVSATVSVFAVASVMLATSSVFMLLFGGLLVNLSTMADWLRWLRWLSTFRYSLNALSINELKDKEFCSSATANGSRVCSLAGNQYLRNQGVEFETPFDLWLNEIALAAFAVVFMFLAYVQLRRLYKYR